MPSFCITHLLQSAGMPDCVGPGGAVLELVVVVLEVVAEARVELVPEVEVPLWAVQMYWPAMLGDD